MKEKQTSGLFPARTDKNKIPELWDHQAETLQFGIDNPIVYDMSDPGTGKTRAWIEVMKVVLAANSEGKRGKAIVLAPKSILGPAWAADLQRYAPDDLTFSVCHAANRAKAFAVEADVYITNHDAIKWIAKNPTLVFTPDRDFRLILIDEITAFKHATSQRSKAVRKIAKRFERRTGLSGTPNSNGMCDLHHQMLVLDEGLRLGASFFRYRNVVCEPIQVGPDPTRHVRWDDRPGASEAIADLLSDCTIRHVFEECVQIPEHNKYFVHFDLNPKHKKAYETLKEHALIEYETGEVTAFNAGVLAQKLLQMSSGAVYTQSETEDNKRVSEVFSTDRYNLVLDLVEAREQCVVAFVWQHQKQALTAAAEARGLSYAVLDGSVTSSTKRDQIVNDFQAGLIKVLFIHPRTGAHGLTLTRGTSTIWASPVYDAELFTQLNKRIYRGGQTRKTETVMVCGTGTLDEDVYERLDKKLDRMDGLLEMITD